MLLKNQRVNIASALSELLQQDPTQKSPKRLKHGSGHSVIDPSRPWPTVGLGISQNLSRRKRNAQGKKMLLGSLKLCKPLLLSFVVAT